MRLAFEVYGDIGDSERHNHKCEGEGVDAHDFSFEALCIAVRQ